MNEKELDKIRKWLIENIFRNPAIMHDDTIRCAENPYADKAENESIDLPEVIAGLYECLHMEVAKEEYDYMFHWANKCGAWVESDFFKKLINEGGQDGEE